MARGRKTTPPNGSDTPAPAGHNGGLTEEDEAALYAHFIANIRKAQQAASIVKAEYDEARGEVTSWFAKAKGELSVKRKDFERLLAKLDMDDDEFRADQAAEHRMFMLAGLPVGAQLDMFGAGRPDTADDMARSYEKGKRAGLAGDDPSPPSTLHPAFIPEWQRGWADGADDLGKKTIRAMELINARASAGKMTAEEPEEGDGEGEEEDDASPAALKAKAKKLKDSGWTEPTKEEAAFA